MGGLIGKVNKGKIEESFATGTVYGNGGNDRVGGLIGSFYIEGIRGVSRDNYATGDVFGNEGNDFVGGLVGLSFGGIIASYASGNVAGDIGIDYVGGLVGFH